jgi:hypothetical protein
MCNLATHATFISADLVAIAFPGCRQLTAQAWEHCTA